MSRGNRIKRHTIYPSEPPVSSVESGTVQGLPEYCAVPLASRRSSLIRVAREYRRRRSVGRETRARTYSASRTKAAATS
jgi:hypothetical protein